MKCIVYSNALVNISKLVNRRNDPIKFVDDYGSMIVEAKRKTTEEEPESEPEPSRAKTKRQLHQKFINEIRNCGKIRNEQIFKEYFFYRTPLFLVKELYNSNQNINDEIVKHINDTLIELKTRCYQKKNIENENPNRIVDIVEKILNFNKQQKGKGLARMLALHPSDLVCIGKVSDCKVFDHKHIKMLTLKQMLQRLPIADDKSETLLNEIRQIIYSLYYTKEIT